MNNNASTINQDGMQSVDGSITLVQTGTTIGWIPMKFGKYIHVPKRMTGLCGFFYFTTMRLILVVFS